MKRFIVLSIILISITFDLYSQAEYRSATLFFINQDSIKGDLRYSFPWKPVMKESVFKYNSFDKDAVESYEFSNGRNFQKFKLKYFDNSVEDIFAEVYLKGEITYVGYKKKQYLKIRSQENLLELTKRNYRGLFSLIMPDNSKLLEESKTMIYSEENIINFIKKYHETEGKKFRTYEKSKDKVNLNLMLNYGFSRRKLDLQKGLESVEGQDNTTSFNRSFTFISEVSLPEFSRLISFNLGLEKVNNINFKTNYSFGNSLFPSPPLNFTIDITNLMIGLRFQAQSRLISPFVSFGVVKPVIVWESTNLSSFEFASDYFGIYASGGIYVDTSSRIKPLLELKYDNFTGATSSNLRLNFQNVQYNIGIKYLLITSK